VVNEDESELFFKNKFPCCSKSGNQPQGDLAKSGYKINREVENLGIRLHVVEPQEPIGLNMAISKEKKLEICPNPPKVLMISKLFFS